MTVLKIKRGAKVVHGGEEMKIASVNGFDQVTLLSRGGEYFHVAVADLHDEAIAMAPRTTKIDLIRQAKVPAYLAAFGPLLERARRTKSEVTDAGGRVGIGVGAAYRVLKRYDETHLTSELPPPTRNGGRGGTRLKHPRAEEIIQEQIEVILLARRNHTPRLFYRKVREALAAEGYEVSQETLRQRVANIPEHKWNKARKGAAVARRTDDPLKGSYPDVRRPLDVVQIDHWTADMEILSEDRLTLIGRPWVTLAIDVFSRMVYGMNVGLDAPGFIPVGLAMINGMLRKDKVAERYNLRWDNPICGHVRQLEADNAREFTGQSLAMAARHFNFDLRLRPLGQPQYGGHIERLNGTLATLFKDLPGATGSSTGERKDLRPEKTAVFTLEDLTRELWLLVDEYHNTVHTGIHMTPLEKYSGHFFGPEGQRNPLPTVPHDTDDLRLHWYPLIKRTVQRYGIRIEHLDYLDESLTYLIQNRSKGDVLWVRRDPFDIRRIFYFHPQREEWLTVPTRHLLLPTASIYELAQARRTALMRKRDLTPENLIGILHEQQKHVEEATAKTRSAQRNHARGRSHARIREERSAPVPTPARPTEPAAPELVEVAAPPPPAHRAPAPPPAEREADLSAILAEIDDDDIDGMFE